MAYLINLSVSWTPDQLEYFIVKPTDLDNDLDDEWEMEEAGESIRNIFDVMNDEDVE